MSNGSKRPIPEDHSWPPLPYEVDPPSPEDDPFYSEFEPERRPRPVARTYEYSRTGDDFFAGLFGLIILIGGLGSGALYFTGKGILYSRGHFTEGLAAGYTYCYYWTPFSTFDTFVQDQMDLHYCKRIGDAVRS